MSAPRRVIPGQTLSITRRCTDRRFYLKPSRALNAAILYVVAEACQRFGMELHAVCVMFNHVHLHVTDPHGRYPLFMQVVFRNITRVVKHYRPDIEGAVFDKRPAGVMALLTPEAVAQQLAYVVSNPVSAGLVARPGDYPGVATQAEALDGGSWELKRPEGVLKSLPATVKLRITPWRSRERGLSAPERQAEAEQVQALAKQLIEETRVAKVRQGWGIKSLARVMKCSHLDKPRKRARGSAVVPAIAASNPAVMRRAKKALVLWRRAYRDARAALAAGLKCIFPVGTWWLPRHNLAKAHAPDANLCPIASCLA